MRPATTPPPHEADSRGGKLTTEEIAPLVGLTRSGVVKAANAGTLPCEKTPGGHRRFDAAVVAAAYRARGDAVPVALERRASGAAGDRSGA